MIKAIVGIPVLHRGEAEKYVFTFWGMLGIITFHLRQQKKVKPKCGFFFFLSLQSAVLYILVVFSLHGALISPFFLFKNKTLFSFIFLLPPLLFLFTSFLS